MISDSTIKTVTKTILNSSYELGPGKVTADQGGVGFAQAGVAEYREIDNGAAAPAYDFVPSGHFLPLGDPQVDYRAI